MTRIKRICTGRTKTNPYSTSVLTPTVYLHLKALGENEVVRVEKVVNGRLDDALRSTSFAQ